MSTNNNKTGDKTSRIDIIQAIQTPLSFFVLVVLIVEVYFGYVAATATGQDRLYIIIGMFILIFLVALMVTFLAYTKPDALTAASHSDFTDSQISQEANDRYDKIARYFDSTGQKFLDDLRVWTIRGTGKRSNEIISIEEENGYIKLWRLLKEHRVVLSIRNYITPPNSPSNSSIPPDRNPDLIGEETVRLIYCEFEARVDGAEQKINIRLRKEGARTGSFPLFKGEDARKEILIRNRKWRNYQGLLGPIRADLPCQVSLDIMPGPAGEGKALYIRNLIIEEWREKDE